MMIGRRHVLLAAPAAALQAGCSSPDPHYYSIAVRPGPTLAAGPKIVRLKDIGLASYLDRREIVRSSEGYRLDIMANDWWGEPLGSMLGRVLVLELGQRLPGSSVYGESGAINADENASVGVNVQRLDSDKAGTLILLAQVAVDFNRPRRSVARAFDIRRPLPTPDIPGLVAAISDAVGELADKQANLEKAIESHRMIGQAVGVLVERHRLTPSQAFQQLRRASQDRNVRLREIARRVLETGLDPSVA